MKKSRRLSFFVVSLVYVLAIILGVIVYNVLDFYFAINLLIADVLATILVFIFSLIFKNASVYDPYWSIQPIVIVLAYCFKCDLTIYRILPLIAICLWGIRLTANWAYTFKSLEHQDWRYTMLKEKTKVFYPVINFIGIHMVPTLIVYACTLPAVYLLEYEGTLKVFSIIFFLLSVFAFTMQGIADIQMHKFRKKNTGTFIRDGLWKYSRHPNYLGEILMWWGIGMYAIITLDKYYYLIIGAILNTLLFLFVSIPMAENRQKNRKPGFEEYKKETRMLFPIKKWLK